VDSPLEEARRRLQLLLGLSEERAEQAVAEVLDSMRFELDEYIQARHGALQQQGLSNPQIYEHIAVELRALRFLGPPLSARQIRRRIYG
jgi:septum formation topological specificity factor MinE